MTVSQFQAIMSTPQDAPPDTKQALTTGLRFDLLQLHENIPPYDMKQRVLK
jgi:hypothetical protein